MDAAVGEGWRKLAVYRERVLVAMAMELREATEQLTAYQIAKDNLELRLVSIEHPHQQVY
jgi:hypothetical protein